MTVSVTAGLVKSRRSVGLQQK